MRFKLTRDFYIPKHPSAVVRNKSGSAVVYLDDEYRLSAMGFYGKAQKPSFHYSYRTAEARAKSITEWFASIESTESYKAERQAKRREFVHSVKVGDIFNTCWGYDQTNTEFYEVTRLVGSSMVEVRQIGTESQDTGWLRGQCVPMPGAFLKNAETHRCRVGEGNYLTIDGHHASRTEYREIAGARVYNSHYWSSYA